MIMERIQSPYEILLGMYIVDKKEGFCKIGLPYRKELMNPHGNFHGGAIASIVDPAVVQGLRTLFLQGPYLTVRLEIRYKNKSSAQEIYAESRSKHLKGKFFQSEVKVLDKDNLLIAEAMVKSYLPAWKG
jgi:uncharacterized protein (TIGR00369 family)